MDTMAEDFGHSDADIEMRVLTPEDITQPNLDACDEVENLRNRCRPVPYGLLISDINPAPSQFFTYYKVYYTVFISVAVAQTLVKHSSVATISHTVKLDSTS